MTPEELLVIGDSIIAGARPGEAVEAVITWSRDTEARAYDGEIEAFTFGLAGLEVQVLNAQDFDKGPIARIPLPVRVPAGFHGTWAPGDQIAA